MVKAEVCFHSTAVNEEAPGAPLVCLYCDVSDYSTLSDPHRSPSDSQWGEEHEVVENYSVWF